jgi:hypothetical protein
LNLGQWDSWDILKKPNCPTENRWYIWQWDNWDGWDSVLRYGLSRFLSGKGKDDAHGKANGIVNGDTASCPPRRPLKKDPLGGYAPAP